MAYSSGIRGFLSIARDTSGSLLEPDVLIPSSFRRSKEPGLDEGERRLMTAILSDGVEAYISQMTGTRSRLLSGKIDAKAWVEVENQDYVFSFDNVCESLGLNPKYLRAGLRRYVEAANKEGKGSGWRKIRRPRKR